MSSISFAHARYLTSCADTKTGLDPINLFEVHADNILNLQPKIMQ